MVDCSNCEGGATVEKNGTFLWLKVYDFIGVIPYEGHSHS